MIYPTSSSSSSRPADGHHHQQHPQHHLPSSSSSSSSSTILCRARSVVETKDATGICSMSVDDQAVAAPAKRMRFWEATTTSTTTPPCTAEPIVGDDDSIMDVEDSSRIPATDAVMRNSSNNSSIPTNPDEILVQMVMQSGHGYSYEQVVQFCRQSGIPLSRMLRLDLLNYCGHPPPQAEAPANNM